MPRDVLVRLRLECSTSEALRGFEQQGKQGIYFRGTGEQRPNFEGNRGTKTMLGNREHEKTNFRFWKTGEQANLFQGNKGTGTPWEGLTSMYEQSTDILDQARFVTV